MVSLNISFQWPVEDGRITSTFGESRGDHFHDGIDVISSNNNIYPVDDGDLIYFWGKSIFPTENYPGSGNYIIIKHKNNLYSLYLHLSDDFKIIKTYIKKDYLGFIGNTGRSYGKHLHFSILNKISGESINPFLILPQFIDIKKPQIFDIFIRVGKSYFLINDNSTIRLTQHYPLLIKIVDSINGTERLGIYKLKVIFNNKEMMEINFSKISITKNVLTICNKQFHDLFDERGYYKINNITYIDGLNHLKIITLDFTGNKSIKELSFNVDLEIN